MKKIVQIFAVFFIISSAWAFADDWSLPFQKAESMPNEAKPRVYWWWLHSMVSEEGITNDLEELAAKGVGGVLIFDAGGPTDKTPDPGDVFMSEGWRKKVVHAVKEAHRLGLEVSINLCSGWDAGGPWITPEFACKHTVFHEQEVTGPGKFQGKLSKPNHIAGFYRDLAVYAVPTPQESRLVIPKVTASSCQEKFQPVNALDGNRGTFWVSNGWEIGDGPTQEKPEWVLLEYSEKHKAKQLELVPHAVHGPKAIELQISDDGNNFRAIAASQNLGTGEVLSFDEVSSKFYRILITSSHNQINAQIVEVRLGLSVPMDLSDLFRVKAALSIPGTLPICNEISLQPFPSHRISEPWKTDSFISLSDKLDADDELDWDIPEGTWTIFRIGVAPTGRQVGFSSVGAAGLEMDWLNREAMDFHFKSMAEVIINDLKKAGLGDLVGTTLKYFHDDSWEVGAPNGTTNIVEEFKKYRGYDPSPYLPALAGHFIESADITDRFLYDYRKTIADCIANNHYKQLQELAAGHGMKIHCEGTGPCVPFAPAMNGLQNLGFCDVPMGEFWSDVHYKDANQQNIATKVIGSAAHTYGRRFAAAEAYTCFTHWLESPETMKPFGDIAFCEGINRYFFHTSTAARSEDGKPGNVYFAGTHFNRNVTWWPKAAGFVDYISRCQYLLSRGLFVADVCSYQGDFAPNFAPAKHVLPTLGPGFDYDICDTTVLMEKMSVKDGRIVLPDGMSYAVLELPDRTAMPLEVLEKVARLVEDGATVFGPKPQTDPGLFDYPRRDAKVKKLADAIWGACDGKNITRHSYGRGKVVWGESLKSVLQEKNIEPDFAFQGTDDAAKFDYIHRKHDIADIYFVVNRKPRQEQVELTFRVDGKVPEIWDPVTGEIANAKSFENRNGTTSLDCAFDAYESFFFVFRSKNGASETLDTENRLKSKPILEMSGSWEVSFDPQWGGPEKTTFEQLDDWTKSLNAGIKHYSGTAVYQKTFSMSEIPDAPIYLYLGEVKNIAEVSLNGKKLGTVWTAPWRIDVSGAIRTGENELEISVSNLWPNRLIGDASLPEDKRVGKTNIRYPANTPLLPSGLLGPVRLQTVNGRGSR